MAALSQNTLRMVEPSERAFVEYPEPDTVEEATTATKFLSSKLVDSFQRLLPKVKRWKKQIQLQGKSAGDPEVLPVVESLQQFDPQITQTVLTIDSATTFLVDDQSFKKATALLILGMRWKRVVAKRREEKRRKQLPGHKQQLSQGPEFSV